MYVSGFFRRQTATAFSVLLVSARDLKTTDIFLRRKGSLERRESNVGGDRAVVSDVVEESGDHLESGTGTVGRDEVAGALE